MKHQQRTLTFFEEEVIRNNTSGLDRESSLATILDISPSAAAEVALHAARHGRIAENKPRTAFKLWADDATR